ncbi:response regulator [Phaeocystidibacter luteus]|uniref:Response regulator n=1 Tax=Phaeocystidibacter luteus TaxID=911197 RepID=A0A6N6RLZ9_9FLAO|nr:response regulator [Phaeocystidibacter luteus]KAB2814589.1 response regulator [Phaeocystidibacter luteus]
MKTILLVDDDPIHNVILKRAINNACPDVDVIDFTEPIRALEYLSTAEGSDAPSIIFLDLEMPIMNGFEFADTLGSNHTRLLSSTQVHMVSSSVIESDIQKAKDHPHIQGFISKPVGRNMLEEIIGCGS